MTDVERMLRQLARVVILRRCDFTMRKVFQAVALVGLLAAGISANAEEKAAESLRPRDDFFVRVARSAQLCRAQSDRATALAAIAKAKKYGRLGGVINVREMKGLQEDVEAADDQIQDARHWIAKGYGKALACSAKQVVLLIKCYAQSESNLFDDACKVADVQTEIEMLNLAYQGTE